MSVGEALQKIRQDRNLTQQEVASKMYVTRQTISRWEQEKTMPNIYALKDLAQLYDVSLDELTGTHLLNSKKEEGSKMRKINWLALFGFFWFNVIVTLGVVLAVGGILLGLWMTIIAFAASPLLLVGEWLTVHMMGWVALANLNWYQVPISLILCAIGLGAFPLLKNLTVYLTHFFERYVRYNVRSIYSEN
jgi:transcriptional regulator with XRE-family HTH domain